MGGGSQASLENHQASRPHSQHISLSDSPLAYGSLKKADSGQGSTSIPPPQLSTPAEISSPEHQALLPGSNNDDDNVQHLSTMDGQTLEGDPAKELIASVSILRIMINNNNIYISLSHWSKLKAVYIIIKQAE